MPCISRDFWADWTGRWFSWPDTDNGGCIRRIGGRIRTGDGRKCRSTSFDRIPWLKHWKNCLKIHLKKSTMGQEKNDVIMKKGRWAWIRERLSLSVCCVQTGRRKNVRCVYVQWRHGRVKVIPSLVKYKMIQHTKSFSFFFFWFQGENDENECPDIFIRADPSKDFFSCCFLFGAMIIDGNNNPTPCI
jgi:hypothetical protein